MGHLATKDEILKQLQKRLHKNPIGVPEHTSVYEILSILFSEKEAEVGSKFPVGAVTFEELQNVIGMNREELEEILEGMTKKGLVVTSKKDHKVRYLLSMAMGGFFEFTFMRTSDSLPMKRLAELMYTYSSLLNDPYIRWYADYMGVGHGKNILGILMKNDDIKGKPPTDLPQSRYFPGVGLVSIHTNFGKPEEDINFLFHSDPYGGVSHGHPDQNAFTIEAFGEALAITSGYYPWYGSDHHRNWQRQTKSSNSITIDGWKGQQGVAAAKGKVVIFENRDVYDYILGDATQAYMGLLTRFHRHVIHIRPGVYVIYDDLEAPEPVTFEWWLHALSEMSVNESGKSIIVSEGDSRLKVNFLQSGKLKFDQFSGFPDPPEYRGEGRSAYKDQWHVTVSTVLKSTKAQFITVLVPFKKDNQRDISFGHLVEDINKISFELKIDGKKYYVSLLPEVSVKEL